MKNVTIVLAVVAVLALAGQAWGGTAATFEWNTTAADKNWVSSSNWTVLSGTDDDFDGVPDYDDNDIALIRNGGTAWIKTGDTAETKTLSVAYYGSGYWPAGPPHNGAAYTGTVKQTGGDMKSRYSNIGFKGLGSYYQSGGTAWLGDLTVGSSSGSLASPLGYFELSEPDPTGNPTTLGGAKCKVASTGGGHFIQTGGAFDCQDLTIGSGGKWVISGGSIETTNPISGWDLGLSGILHVIGDDSTITAGGVYNQYAGSILKSEIDGGGITAVNVTATSKDDGDVLFTTDNTDPENPIYSVIEVVDAGAADGDHILMSWAGTVTGTPQLDLPSGDWTWKNETTFASDGNIVVNKVPEPATMVLLGLGGLGVLLRRRRK